MSLIGYVIPYDGVPQEDLVTVALPVTIISSALSIGGIIYALICFLFNAIFHKKRWGVVLSKDSMQLYSFVLLPQADSS